MKPWQQIGFWFCVGLIQLQTVAFANPSFEEVFLKGVSAYRHQAYQEAESVFGNLAIQNPQHAEVLYYLAITQARQGEVDAARNNYQMVIRLAPQSEAANLAKKGLQYLSDSSAFTQLDPPPKAIGQSFSQPVGQTGYRDTQTPDVNDTPRPPATLPAMSQVPAQGGGQPPVQQNNGITPDMMALMLMGGSGGGNETGMNPMMLQALMGAGNSTSQVSQPPGNASSISPEMMQSLMMNQMLQNDWMNGFSDKHSQESP